MTLAEKRPVRLPWSERLVLPTWVPRLGRGLIRWAWLVFPLFAAVVAVGDSAGLNQLVDGQLFTTSGCQILTGHVATAYSDPGLQSGPLQVGVYCLTSKVSPLFRSAVWFALFAAIGTFGALTALRAVRRWAGLGPSPAVTTVAVAYIALWVVPSAVGAHGAELAVPLLWVVGAILVRRAPVTAGVLLGASVGWELWGLVAIPIALAARTWGRRLAGLSAAAAVAVVLILPFALAGHLAMFHFGWPVFPGTLPSLIWPDDLAKPGPGHFGVVARVLQVVLACAGCALVAYRVRRDRRLLLWAPAMAGELLRLLVDPTLYTYYWVVPQLLATVALVCAATTRQRLLAGALAVLQTAGALNEFRIPVIAVSLVLVAALVFERAPRPARLRGQVPAGP